MNKPLFERQKQKHLEKRVTDILDALNVDCLPEVIYRIGKHADLRSWLIIAVLLSKTHWALALSGAHFYAVLNLRNLRSKTMTSAERLRVWTTPTFPSRNERNPSRKSMEVPLLMSPNSLVNTSKELCELAGYIQPFLYRISLLNLNMARSQHLRQWTIAGLPYFVQRWQKFQRDSDVCCLIKDQFCGIPASVRKDWIADHLCLDIYSIYTSEQNNATTSIYFSSFSI